MFLNLFFEQHDSISFNFLKFFYEVPFIKYVLHSRYAQFCAFPILSQNGNEKSWTAFYGL